jgi:hypothetical protein
MRQAFRCVATTWVYQLNRLTGQRRREPATYADLSTVADWSLPSCIDIGSSYKPKTRTIGISGGCKRRGCWLPVKRFHSE